MQEENLRRNIPPPLPDQEAMASGRVSKLTRTNSDSSAITADISRNASIHNDYSAPGPSTVWTDEKHSLYLDSLEASFVKHLYSSIAVRGCSQKILWGPCSSQAVPTNSCDSAHQFMVLQDRSRQKINPKRNMPSLESTADSHFVQENPCIRHFSSSVKRCSVACHDEEHSVASSERLHVGENSPFCSARSSELHSSSRLYHDSSVGTAIEVSDQNFVEVSQGEKSNCRAVAKRLKKVVTDASINDRVVPSGNPGMNNASTASRASFIREEQVNQELRSEDLNNFAYQKSENHYYLRES